MVYNKLRNKKISDKKILHKIRKHWVVVSSALLMTLGGGALATQAPAHASEIDNNSNDNSNNNKMNVPVKSAGTHLIQQNNNQSLNSQLNQSNSLVRNSGAASMASSAANPAGSTNGKFVSQGGSNASSTTEPRRIERHADQMHQQILLHSVVNPVQGNTSFHNHLGVNSGSKDLHGNQLKSFNTQYKPGNSNLVTHGHRHLLGDSDSDNSDNIGTIVIRCENDQKGNEIENQTLSSNVNGTPFTDADKNSFKGAPKGYLYDGFTPSDSNITHYIGGKAQFFNIKIKPAPAVPKFNRVIIRYEITNKGNMMTPGNGAQIAQYNAAGQPFPLKQFLSDVPDGYYLDPNKSIIAGADVKVYKPGTQMVQIGVLPDSDKPKPNNSSQKRMVSMPINYMNGSSIVKTLTSPNRVEGSPFDIVPYEQAPDMPSNYSFENSNAPSVYTYGRTITINVTPTNSNNNGGSNTSQTDQMNINYLNFSDFAPEGHLISKGMNGQLFDANQYKMMVPSGFTFYSFDGTVPKAYVPNGQLNILVVPSVIKMPVNYQLSNGTVIKSVTATGSINQPFNVKPYWDNAPAGYEVVSANGPSKYQINQSVDIIVQPVPKPTPQQVTMDVRYIDRTNGNHVISTVPVTGVIGSHFNAEPYEDNIPRGYRIYSTGPVPATYQAGGSFDIDVVPIVTPHPVATGSINVSYVDAKGNVIGNSYNVSNAVGTPFNIKDYETPDKIKSGYHFVSTQSNVTKFEPGNQSVKILVAPNVNPNNNSNSNSNNNQNPVQMSLYYVDSDNNIISQQEVSGIAGSALPLAQYEQNVPQGYHVNNVITSNSVNTFTPNGLIIVSVAKNQVQPTSNSSTNYVPNNNTNYIPRPAPAPSSTSTVPQSRSTAAVTSQSAPSSSSASQSTSSRPHRVINNNHGNRRHERHYSNHSSHMINNNDVNTNYGAESRPSATLSGNEVGEDNGDESNLGSPYDNGSSVKNDTDQNGSKKLPQTGEETSHNNDIAAILMAISLALSSLGYAVRRRRHND